jgi:hypothetical protein
MTVEHQPREERAEEDATGVSSDLQRLFEESSFGSPQAQESYTQPPPHLVTNTVDRVHRAIVAVDIEGSTTRQPRDQQRLRNALYQILETHFHSALPPHGTERPDVTPTGSGRPHDVSPLVSDLMLLADRDATQQRHAMKPRTSPSLTGSWWLPADDDPDGQVNQETQIRLGQHAFDLAQEYLATGKLDRARHWLTIAAEYNIQDARSLLADLTGIQEALDSPEASISTGTALDGDNTATKQDRPTDEVHDVGAMVQTAREQAQAVVRDAHRTAGEILAEARSKADSLDTGTGLICIVTRDPAVHRRQPNMRPWLLPAVEPCDRETSQGKRSIALFKHGNDWSGRVSRDLIMLWDRCAATPNKLLLTCKYQHVPDEPHLKLRSWLANRNNETVRIWDVVTPLLDVLTGGVGPLPTWLLLDECGRQLGLAGSCHDEAVPFWHWINDTVDGDPPTAPRLWTPPPAGADDSSPGAEQQRDGAQIVVGPEFRQALDKLNEHLAATGG